jgi:solute carrier family 25 carnitine/acylcarnitine transporter 20/29
MTPPLISLAILNTTNFASYNYFRNLFGAERGWDITNFCAGAMGAPFGSTISTVEHMIKTQMQLDNIGDKRFRGSFHCLTTIIKERGWKAVYTGHAVNTVREGVFLGTYFYTYEGLRIWLQSLASHEKVDKHHTSAWTVPVAGGISGAWAWFASFPLDCIKATIQGSRLQPEVSSSGEVVTSQKLKSVDVLKGLLRTKGWKGLYAGITPSIARAFIVSGSRFSAYEFTLRTFGDYFQ